MDILYFLSIIFLILISPFILCAVLMAFAIIWYMWTIIFYWIACIGLFIYEWIEEKIYG